MKHLLSLCCVCLALMLVCAFAAACGEETLHTEVVDESGYKTVISYTLDENGEATITKSSNVAVIPFIPAEVDGHPVTGIGDYAFRYYEGFDSNDNESVTIPASVTRIGTNPFANWQKLKKIEVAPGNERFESVEGALYDRLEKRLICCPLGKEGELEVKEGTEIIGEYACGSDDDWGSFHSYLTSVTLPDSVTEIREGAFRSALIAGIDFPASLRLIGDEAFCSSALAGVTFSEGLESIGRKAFAYTLLDEVRLPESLEYIAKDSFARCEKLKAVEAADEILALLVIADEDRYQYSLDEEMNAMITGVILIDAEDALILPSTLGGNPVTAIADGAFDALGEVSWYRIRSIEIPASVTQIGANPFRACFSLETIRLDPENPYFEITGGVLYDRLRHIVICLADREAGPVTLPADTEIIGAYAFSRKWSPSAGLDSLTFPEGLREIREGAFFMSALKNAVFPSSLKLIGKEAFAWGNLESVTFSEGIERIEEGAFSYGFAAAGCSDIFLPESLQYIGPDAFSHYGKPDILASERVLDLMGQGASEDD